MLSSKPLRRGLVILVLLGVCVALVAILRPPQPGGDPILRWLFAGAVAIAVALLALPSTRTGVGHAHKYFGSASLGLALSSFVPFYLSAADGRHTVNSDYFATVAAILPVLLLAVTVDSKRPGNEPTEKLETAAYLLVVSAGEFWALHALAFQELAQPFPFAVSCSAMVGAVGGLTMLVLPTGETRPAVGGGAGDGQGPPG